MVTRVPAPDWVQLGPSFATLGITPDPFGEEVTWAFAHRWVFRILASPQSGEPMLEAPKVGDDFFDGGAFAYWSALLNLLIYSFGWPRPDRGLRWWCDAGKPLTDPRLQLISEVWGSDGQLDWFAAWLWGTHQVVQTQLFEEVLGYRHDGIPVSVDREWIKGQALAADSAGIPAPVSMGGYDPMHLWPHAKGPLEVKRGELLWLPSEQSYRHATLLLDSMSGWYRALATVGGGLPSLAGGHSWYVDVIVKPVGWLGTFRRSGQTGLWFSGQHRYHLRGV